MPVSPPFSGRRLWTLTKLWIAIRDVPEVAILAVLAGGVLSMGAYTYYREMWTEAGESFPSLEVRRDPEKQLALTAAYHNPGFFYRIAQWKHDDKGMNIGVFDNRARPFEYNLPTKGKAHTGSRYDSHASSEPAEM